EKPDSPATRSRTFGNSSVWRCFSCMFAYRAGENAPPRRPSTVSRPGSAAAAGLRGHGDERGQRRQLLQEVVGEHERAVADHLRAGGILDQLAAVPALAAAGHESERAEAHRAKS